MIKLKHILLELSDGEKKRLKLKWFKENEHLTDDIMDYYIGMYEKYGGNIVFKNVSLRDIAFKYLEKIVDTNFENKRNDIKYDDDFDKNVLGTYQKDLVYEGNGLVILLGDLKPKCIRYGKGHSWCISRTDSSNMFYGYRMQLDFPVFYFVFDRDMKDSDPSHALVVLVTDEGKYLVADARNSTNSGQEIVKWDYIIKLQPKLKELKYLFKSQPPTEEEKKLYNKLKYRLNDILYKELTYVEKEYYISFGHDLSKKQIIETPNDLVNKYAVAGYGKNLNSKLMKLKKIGNSTQRLLKDKRMKYIEEKINSFIDIDILYKIIFTDDMKNISGNLNLNRSGIEFFGTLETVGGYLDLLETPIESLGNLKTVGGYLDLSKSTIESLGNLQTVGGHLDLEDTPIESLGNLKNVSGDLNLSGTPIKSLGNLQTVGNITDKTGHLDLFGTPIKSLGNLQTVGGHLDLGDSKIKSLGNLQIVGDYLNLSDTSIESLGNLQTVGGHLDLGDSKIKSLGNLKDVGDDLYLNNITSLENLQSVGGNIFIPKHMFEKINIPEHLKSKMKLYYDGR